MMSCPDDFMDILRKHSDCTESILRKAAGYSGEDLELSTDPEAIRIRKMVNGVLGECHMMKSFVRLKPQGERVLYGYMRPQHDIWEMVGSFLARRFPGTIVILGNNSRSLISYFDKKRMRHASAGSMASVLERLESFGTSGASDPGDLWDTYYWSQYRPEAKNTRYFKQNVRGKHAKAAGIRRETDSGGTTLEDFDR